MDNAQKIYEISFWIKNEADKKHILKTIESFGGSAIEEGSIFKARLAYPIQKEAAAFFGAVVFTLSETESVKKIMDELKRNQNILRLLICKNKQVSKPAILNF